MKNTDNHKEVHVRKPKISEYGDPEFNKGSIESNPLTKQPNLQRKEFLGYFQLNK